jgi:hypothetical protein
MLGRARIAQTIAGITHGYDATYGGILVVGVSRSTSAQMPSAIWTRAASPGATPA